VLNLIHPLKSIEEMKQIICAFVATFVICSCYKKAETPDYSALIVGKWVCNSYKKDDADTIVNKRPFFLSVLYEYGWDFLPNKQIRYKNNIEWSLASEKNTYSLMENKTLTLKNEDFNGDFSTYNFKILEFTATKLTVHSDLWKSTFFLLKE
jgi:hypothetical protein